MSKSIAPKLAIAHSFGKTKIADLLSRAHTVFTSMTAAADVFTAPPLPLAKLKADLDNLTISSAAAMDGGKKDIARRDKDRHVLEQDLSLLGAYAVNVSNGDALILASSGFVAAAPRVRAVPQPLTRPSIDSIDQGTSGQLLIRLNTVAKANSYEVRYSPLFNGNPEAWSNVAVTPTRKPVPVNGLTPGTIYGFQVRALGRTGFTDWSNSVSRMSI